MKVYLSGKMTGLPDWGFPAFHKAAKWLRDQGHEVLNPAENFDGRTDLPRPVYLRRAIEQVLQAEVVAVLPKWERSPGAKLEVRVARELGLPVAYAADLSPVPVRP